MFFIYAGKDDHVLDDSAIVCDTVKNTEDTTAVVVSCVHYTTR